MLPAHSNDLRKINLKSVLIGNGMTNPLVQYSYYHPTVCTNQSGYGPFVGKEACDKMAAELPKCQKLLQSCYDDPSNSVVCLSAVTYCEATQTEPFYATGRNAYDMAKFGDYDEEAWMAKFLNQPSTMHALGVDKASHGRVHKHTGCDPTVGYRFTATGDGGKATYPHVANILDNGVAALLYSGDRDFICNWLGNQNWLEHLEWSGSEGFRNTTLSPWYGKKTKNAEIAGKYRTYGNLTFATVAESSHFVPYDKPEESLKMAMTWVHEGPEAFTKYLSSVQR